MTAADPRYDEGYWERGEGSNYVSYWDDPGWEPTAALLHQIVPPPARLLEIGCAKGWFLFHAVGQSFDAYGIDVSQYAVDHPAWGMAERMQVASATEIPFGDGWFDIVCSWEVLEHVWPHEIDTAMQEMIRVLAPGGLLIHRIGMLESEDDRSNHMHDVTHVLNENGDWWRAKFEEHGLRLLPDISEMFDDRFADRDWCGRYVAAIPE